MLKNQLSSATLHQLSKIQAAMRVRMLDTLEHLSPRFTAPLYGDDHSEIKQTLRAVFFKTLEDEVTDRVMAIAERKGVKPWELEELALRKLHSNRKWQKRVWKGRHQNPLAFTRRMIEQKAKDTKSYRDRKKQRDLPKTRGGMSDLFWATLSNVANHRRIDQCGDYRVATVGDDETDDEILRRFNTRRTFKFANLNERQELFLVAVLRVAAKRRNRGDRIKAVDIIDDLTVAGMQNSRERFFELKQLICTRDEGDTPNEKYNDDDFLERLRFYK